MSMRFLFASNDRIDNSSLNQGDIIKKTNEVASAILPAHAYYAEAEDYTHFIVLTQSCDLVRRRGAIRAPYITIAAVRPLSVTIEKFFSNVSTKLERTEIEVAKLSLKRKLDLLLERVLHNTEENLFFIPEDGSDNINEDLCAYLHLSIALRPEHYETLLASKIAQLDDVFRAKLGWLKGNIYSRVATPDIEEYLSNAEEYKQQFYEKHTPKDDYLWLSPLQLERLKKQIKIFAINNGIELLNKAQAQAIVDEIPTDIEIISEYIMERLILNGILDKEDGKLIRRAKTIIKNVPALRQLLSQQPE